MKPQCVITAAILPATATADHSASAPANQVQFSEKQTLSPTGCVPPPEPAEALACLPNWTTSDTVNTSVSETGLATCLNATPTPATIKQTCPNDGVVGAVPTPAALTCK
ncbi:MAG TPA: hypothetical protein VMU28_03170 [Terriglobales bacterium]|nr:hypothetical protein [Terriglobales bacterium]